jgi:hypothetical protein
VTDRDEFLGKIFLSKVKFHVSIEKKKKGGVVNVSKEKAGELKVVCGICGICLEKG